MSILYLNVPLDRFKMMDCGRLLLHIALTTIFYIFFGNVSIEKFNNKGVSITKFEETVVDVPPPGN